MPEAPEEGHSKERTLAQLRAMSGELATATLRRLDEELPWYRQLPPGRRSAIGFVAQSGITSFINWFDDPNSANWVAADIFGNAPRELIRSVSLQETLELIRVVVSVVQERFTGGDPQLREAFLVYSRDVAFAAADVYARAAEARGLWDARLEALVVNSILTGEHDAELPGRVAALGWRGNGEVAVIVGTSGRHLDVDEMRRIARHRSSDALIGVQGARVVVVLGSAVGQETDEADQQASLSSQVMDVVRQMNSHFGPGPVVIGPTVGSILDAGDSARAALSGFAVVAAWHGAPRPVLADDLLPERALAGDPLAKATLVDRAFRPLTDRASDLLTTLRAYLDSGRSLEATARDLFVHPNTVRYRLRRIAETLGWDPTEPRDALILQTALILGAIQDRDGLDTRIHYHRQTSH